MKLREWLAFSVGLTPQFIRNRIDGIWPPFKRSQRHAKQTTEEKALNLQNALQKRERKNAKRLSVKGSAK